MHPTVFANEPIRSTPWVRRSTPQLQHFRSSPSCRQLKRQIIINGTDLRWHHNTQKRIRHYLPDLIGKANISSPAFFRRFYPICEIYNGATSSMSSVLFRVFLLLSPLFLVSSSSYENRKMDDNNLRRFTMVDVDLHFASLPSELGPDGLDNLMVASQVLLESGLDVHPTTIIELHVAITSQQIVEDHDIFLHDDSSSDVQLLIHLQVLIRYELAFENEDLSNMDKRVQRILTEDREELIALLKLLDFPFFATLEEVTLIPNDVPIESQPVQVSENETAHRTTVIIIFAVVGVGMLISFMTIIPLFCSKHEENQL